MTVSAIRRGLVRRLMADWASVPPVGTAYIEPITTFHPPSLKNPDIVPVDEPMERSNKHLTRFLRDSIDTWKYRMTLLKHSSPPDMPWAVKTGVEMHQGIYLPFFSANAERKLNGKANNNRNDNPRLRYLRSRRPKDK